MVGDVLFRSPLPFVGRISEFGGDVHSSPFSLLRVVLDPFMIQKSLSLMFLPFGRVGICTLIPWCPLLEILFFLNFPGTFGEPGTGVVS